MSKIEWTNYTWNPLNGCDKISDGCKNCYAIRMAYRLMHNPKMKDKYAGVAMKTAGGALNWSGKINMLQDELLKPLQWKKPAMVFVNSMSDLFHEDVPFEFIDKVFAIMVLSKQHTFQILTKRPARMKEYFDAGLSNLISRWEDATYQIGLSDQFDDTDAPACAVYNFLQGQMPVNVWLGVSVENQKTADERIPLLLQVPAAVRWLSMEPLLSEIDFYKTSFNAFPQDHNHPWRGGPILQGIHWIVAGGESGPGARPMHPDWIRIIRDQCNTAGVPFFFKQWGEYTEGSTGKIPSEKWFMVYDNGEIAGEIVERGRNAHLMSKVGKKAAGRFLDGIEHNGFPILTK